MNEFLLLKYAHIIAFVYWLGGDLGTYVASNYAISRQVQPEARRVALKIMLACDQGPKLAMPLIVVLGIHMSSIMGLLHLPPWGIALVWAVGLYWLSVVLVLYFNEGKAFTATLSKLDLYFRLLIFFGLILWSVVSFFVEGFISADWVAYKLLIFAVLVGCGIMIRLNLKPFIPAFSRMLTDGPSDSVNDRIHHSMMACRPYVYTIWLGLFVNAALGVRLI